MQGLMLPAILTVLASCQIYPMDIPQAQTVIEAVSCMNGLAPALLRPSLLYPTAPLL